MSKLNLALILGGISSEREVSLKTGEQIFRYLDKNKYNVTKYDPKTDLEKLISDRKNIDLAFLALHGQFGEDGRIQGLLDMLAIPYTGSGVLGSSIGMHKIISKQILIQNKIPTPPFRYFSKNTLDKNIFQKIKPPFVVKPNDSGSSVGVSIVRHTKQIKPALEKAFSESKYILIEKYIKGLELTVPVLGDQALPVIEIVPQTEFFDYQAKYTPGECAEIVPARIPANIAKLAQKLSIKTHQLLFSENYSRVDLILDKQKQLWILEINTLPGMTQTSLLPQSAKAAGIDFPELLDKIIQLALRK